MKFVIYTNALSEHQMPLAREIVAKIGVDNFRYVYTSKNGQKLQESKATDEWIVYGEDPCLEEADVMLVGGIRPIDLMERRLEAGKTTLYMSERWFKPVCLGVRGWCLGVSVPGWVRMVVPSYRKMAKRFANLFKHEKYRFLPIGPWSKKDMMAICKWFTGRTYEEKMVDWGYFVAPSENKLEKVVGVGQRNDNVLKVLWVGRMLKLKRVDTIIRAVAMLQGVNAQGLGGSGEGVSAEGLGVGRKISLTLVGDGPERKRLEGLVHSAKLEGVVRFMPSQPIAKIREIMREHDVYVFSSNGMDGWGAVVSEALEEGMKVLGTYETGAAATILPESNLFHCGDYKTLAKKLSNKIEYIPICDWSAKRAAERLLKVIE